MNDMLNKITSKVFRKLKVTNMVSEIYEANKGRRSVHNLLRRIAKTSEELGELNEAYLYVSSVDNSKNKTWEDVREEAVDVILMGVDIALTPLPIDDGKTPEEIETEVLNMVAKKLEKWKAQIAANKDCTLTKKDELE